MTTETTIPPVPTAKESPELIRFLEDLRWNGNPVCPHCGCPRSYRLNGPAAKGRPRLKCADCRAQFTVTSGSVLEGSRLPLATWIEALCLLTQSAEPLGVSDLRHALGISYRAAENIHLRLLYAARRSGKLAGALSTEQDHG